MNIKRFTNLLAIAAGVVLCTWSGECSYEDGVSYGHISNNSEQPLTGNTSGTVEKNTALEGIDEVALFKKAGEIARENQARWTEESKNIPANELDSRFGEFQKQYPTNVELIFQELKAQAVKDK